MDIAISVKKVVESMTPGQPEINIVTEPSDDIRSYHINSQKIDRVLGFKPKYSIEQAIRDLVDAFQKSMLPDPMDDDWYYNIGL